MHDSSFVVTALMQFDLSKNPMNRVTTNGEDLFVVTALMQFDLSKNPMNRVTTNEED